MLSNAASAAYIYKGRYAVLPENLFQNRFKDKRNKIPTAIPIAIPRSSRRVPLRAPAPACDAFLNQQGPNLWAPTSDAIDDIIIVRSRSIIDESRNLLDSKSDKNNHAATSDNALEPNRVSSTIIKEEHTMSYWNEASVMIHNSFPLIVAFFLQYLLEMAALFSVGHLGKVELGAVSLATMTANVSGFAIIQGIATCLDTLCPQAYGAGRPKQVGLYVQRCILLTSAVMIPIFFLWYRVDMILPYFVASSKGKLLKLTTSYLRICLFGMPGYIIFECGKRFLQAQGIYYASTFVLFLCVPLNIFLNYFLVWNETFGFGFYGAPLAMIVTNWLLAVFLLACIVFINGEKCWNGFTTEAFTNWKPLIRLAFPGVVMVEAEFFAYEVMTLGSSYLGTTALAAQKILASIVSLAYEIPFAFSVSLSTRIAGFTGAGAVDAAKRTSHVSLVLGLFITVINALILYFSRYSMIGLFTNDQHVTELAAKVMPLAAAMHVLDGMCCQLAGVLRGQGRQLIGGSLNTVGYYAIGFPTGVVLLFKLGLGLQGMWIAITSGLLVVNLGSFYFIRETDWDFLIAKAHKEGA